MTLVMHNHELISSVNPVCHCVRNKKEIL